MSSSIIRFLTCITALYTLSSCGSAKKVTYFYGTEKGTFATNSSVPESVIQKSDILNITVTSLDPEAAVIFNPTIANNMASQQQLAGSNTIAPGTNLGYLVNTEGNVQIPLLGAMKAEGLTNNQLRDKIVAEILRRKLLVDPIVTIRFLNFRVTILGEVGRPNVITVPNEKITLLEALGLAGDVTLYGRKDNVMLIRETQSSRTVNRINLNSSELFTSPFYYLQSGDIVYVEPNEARITATSQGRQNLPVIIGALGLVATVINIIVR